MRTCLADFDEYVGQVAVAGGQAVAVIDLDHACHSRRASRRW